MADMDVYKRSVQQVGRIQIEVNGKGAVLHVYSKPTEFGELIVLEAQYDEPELQSRPPELL